ncbi:NAD(P)/FAD-dependent oxidoreductase [Pseudonocardia oceani]|uniref:NAD(P)/FAD-dependent oxidoreductase n=1 Tax=Pseudonocardia oceani TaxID=2792013 RepID=UPI0027E38FC2|nr:NAD(P)/FAD-dependent oxidoreductase [Pseudonocardia oceani]
MLLLAIAARSSRLTSRTLVQVPRTPRLYPLGVHGTNRVDGLDDLRAEDDDATQHAGGHRGSRWSGQCDGGSGGPSRTGGRSDRPRRGGPCPYNRTTVNKGLLSGAADDAGVALPGMDGLGIDWRTATAARFLDATGPAVELADGTWLRADAVVLATGAIPRVLPAPVDEGARNRVLTLRTAADTAGLRALLAQRPGLVVIAGAGLIGTETAGVLLAAGCPVTVVDPARRPMTRQVGSTVADWITGTHRGAGVDLRMGTAIDAVRESGPSREHDGDLHVELDDGTGVPARAVLACLGVEPATDWLRGSDVTAPGRPGGVLVDHSQRVRDRPGLYAVGDLAAFPGPDGEPVRVEHWGAALGQAAVAATTLLADLGILAAAQLPVPAMPSYSTYVHGVKLTILGWPGAAVTDRLVLGRVGYPRFAVALIDAAGRVVGAVGVGGARAVNRMRPLIARRADAVDLEVDPAAVVVSGDAGNRSER